MRRIQICRQRLLIIAVLAVMLAACGGDDAKPEAPPKAGDDAAAGAFKDLGAKGAAAKGRITYAIDDAGKQSTLVVSQDPPKRSYRTTYDGKDTLLIASDDNTLIACRDDACFKIPGLGSSAGAVAAGGFLGEVTQGLDAFSSLASVVGFVAKESRTIAGRQAACASYKPVFAKDGFEQCLDSKTGVSLFMKYTTGGRTVTVQAQKVEEPAAADFTPTHEVNDIPTGFPTSVPPSSATGP